MTKLKELTAAYIAALDAYDTALKAECDCDAATDAAWAADAVYWDYKDGLKRLQEENSDDH